MANFVPHLLQTNQPVSDARLAQEAHYMLGVMTYYVSRPKIRSPTSDTPQFMYETLYIVLDAAKKRDLQRLLPPNTLTRLQALLEALEMQIASRGQVATFPASCSRLTYL